MYYIYYVKEFNKVGCTVDPLKRMEMQQGLSPWQDYVIDESEDEIEASHLEAYYKGVYKAKWDDDIYMNPINIQNQEEDMKQIINKTSNSRYFGEAWLPKHQFVSACQNGVEFQIDGQFYCEFNGEEVAQLVATGVIQSSRFNQGFYAVPKALLNAKESMQESRMNVIGQNGNDGLHYEKENCKKEPCCHEDCIPEFEEVREWAKERGLYAKGDPKTQMVKLMEELGETAKALLKDDEEEIIDGLGDVLVVLINLSHLSGYRLEDCLAAAYAQIINRTGKMVDGTFIKDE